MLTEEELAKIMKALESIPGLKAAAIPPGADSATVEAIVEKLNTKDSVDN